MSLVTTLYRSFGHRGGDLLKMMAMREAASPMAYATTSSSSLSNTSIVTSSPITTSSFSMTSSHIMTSFPVMTSSLASSLMRWSQTSLQTRNLTTTSHRITRSPDEVNIFDAMNEIFAEKDGFEWHHFRVGSYNAVVRKEVRLRFADDVMAAVVLNTPSFFETTYKEWLRGQFEAGENMPHFIEKIGPNPLHSFFDTRFAKVEQRLAPVRAVSIVDFEPLFDRLPKTSLWAAGHVSGAAYFYRVQQSTNIAQKKRHMGVSLHPKYGGHFSFRGVIVFPDAHLKDSYKEQPPQKTLATERQVEEALDLFNECFYDNRYRNCGNPVETYSELQLKFFNTPAEQRWPLIEHWFTS